MRSALCADCGDPRESATHGRGLCRKCYRRNASRGTLDRFPKQIIGTRIPAAETLPTRCAGPCRRRLPIAELYLVIRGDIAAMLCGECLLRVLSGKSRVGSGG